MSPRLARVIARLEARGFPIEGYLEKLAYRIDQGEATKASDAIKTVIQRSRGRIVDVRVGKGEEHIPLTEAGNQEHTPG